MIRILFRLSTAAEYHWQWTIPAEELAVTTPQIDRRTFLRTAAAGVTAATVSTVPATATVPTGKAKSCIFLMLAGGPSQLDTWDPKPNATSDVRGPFAPIQTRVSGMHLSELFPKMAAMADIFSLIRTMHHEYAPIHENGFQLLNTGRRFGDGRPRPSVGCVWSLLNGDRTAQQNRRHYVAPHPDVETGVNIGRGFGPGHLADRVNFPDFGFNFGDDWTENMLRSRPARDERYGMTPFGQNCLQAVRSVTKDAGRFVGVNMYSTVFDAVSWDCHADDGSLRTTLGDYARTVAPCFDTAFTALLHDLDVAGRLDETLVVAVGEFGRTPKLNANGGRDHWANCWTAIVAGGGVQGGRIIGESDATASEPKDRPVHCAELVATIYHALGIPPATTIPGPDGSPVRVVDAEPVRDLF